MTTTAKATKEKVTPIHTARKPAKKATIVLTPMELKANLEAAAQPVVFDPANADHRAAYATFLTEGRWPIGMRFKDEFPFTSAVTTILDKLSRYAVAKELAKAAANKAVKDAQEPQPTTA